MKKYYLADVLTSIEVLLAMAMVAMAILGVSADWAFVTFVAAELCDAFDGICARRWHYPDDGKRRWWRVHAPAIDQISDIMLGLACLLFVGWRVNLVLALVALGVALLLGFFVQICVKWRPLPWFERHSRAAFWLVMFRRYLYVIAIVVLALALLLATTWPWLVRYIVIGLAVGLGVWLIVIKFNRLSEDKTEL